MTERYVSHAVVEQVERDLSRGGIIDPWERREYRYGELVRHAGKMWMLTEQVRSGREPGAPDSGWRIVPGVTP